MASIAEGGAIISSGDSGRFISRVSDEYYSPDKLIKIRCWKSASLDSGQSPVKMKYTIFKTDKEIGGIHVTYYGKGECYKTHDHQFVSEPTFHVTFINIVEYERKNGYAKRALDALFQGLKQSPFLSEGSLLGLEHDVEKPFLGCFYKKYGFQEFPHLYFSGYANPSIYNVMLARLGEIKFF